MNKYVVGALISAVLLGGAALPVRAQTVDVVLTQEQLRFQLLDLYAQLSALLAQLQAQLDAQLTAQDAKVDEVVRETRSHSRKLDTIEQQTAPATGGASVPASKRELVVSTPSDGADVVRVNIAVLDDAGNNLKCVTLSIDTPLHPLPGSGIFLDNDGVTCTGMRIGSDGWLFPYEFRPGTSTTKDITVTANGMTKTVSVSSSE